MSDDLLIFLCLIFTGAAILSTMALYTRQSLLVAYMLLGTLIGPWGLKWIVDSSTIEEIGNVGIIFLLFLLGLHMQPQKLLHTLKKVSWIVLGSSILFMAAGFGLAYLYGFNVTESLIVGAAVMFSSTIIGLKLLPTTVLHHQHTGEMMVAVLLLQDLIAIFTLLAVHGAGFQNFGWKQVVFILLALPGLLLFAFIFERFILRKLFRRFDRIHEYLFLLAIGWCLSLATFSHLLGLSAEIGAFIGGVSVASTPIALYIAEHLKPVRDFFLVLFFFSMGATFNLHFFDEVFLPAILLAALMLIIKPLVFHWLFVRLGEPKHISWEVGLRLGQLSEFSILLAYVGVHEELLGATAFNLIHLTTMLTFIVSCYLVILRYPTPVALSDKLRRD